MDRQLTHFHSLCVCLCVPTAVLEKRVQEMQGMISEVRTKLSEMDLGQHDIRGILGDIRGLDV